MCRKLSGDKEVTRLFCICNFGAQLWHTLLPVYTYTFLPTSFPFVTSMAFDSCFYFGRQVLLHIYSTHFLSKAETKHMHHSHASCTVWLEWWGDWLEKREIIIVLYKALVMSNCLSFMILIVWWNTHKWELLWNKKKALLMFWIHIMPPFEIWTNFA